MIFYYCNSLCDTFNERFDMIVEVFLYVKYGILISKVSLWNLYQMQTTATKVSRLGNGVPSP